MMFFGEIVLYLKNIMSTGQKNWINILDFYLLLI